MSRENVETAQRAHGAWNANDLDAFLAELHPEMEWRGSIEQAVEGTEGDPYRGHDGAVKAWKDYRGGAFGHLTSHVREVRDLGERVLLLGEFHVTGATSGLDFHQEFGQLVRFREGRLVSIHDFLSHAEAREAAGLSE